MNRQVQLNSIAQNSAKLVTHEANAFAAGAETASAATIGKARGRLRSIGGRILKVYDIAVSVAPQVLAERAVRIRNRRIAYLAVGGVVIGVAAVATLELVKPGTLAKFGRRVKSMFRAGAADAKREVVDAADGLKDAATSADTRTAEVMQSAKQIIDHPFASAISAAAAEDAHAVDVLDHAIDHFKEGENALLRSANQAPGHPLVDGKNSSATDGKRPATRHSH